MSFSAALLGADRWSNGLLAFLAEVDSPAMATLLATRAEAASKAGRPQMAASSGSILLLIIGGSSTVGEAPIETMASVRMIVDDLMREAGTES